MSRTLDDNMVVDCEQEEGEVTTNNTDTVLSHYRHKRKTEMNGTEWFLRVFLL